MEGKVGSKVVIRNYKSYPEYEGKIGIVTDDKVGGGSTNAITVKMEDGRILWPYKPGYTTSQCEWYTELEIYTLDKLKGKDVAINCKTQEEWDKVTEILGYVWSSYSRWEQYKEESCIRIGNESYGNVPFYTKRSYQIIPADQFIIQNTKQPTMDKTQIEQQIQALRDQLQKLEDSMKEPVYKVGDYVVSLIDESIDWHKGAIRKLTKAGQYGQPDIVWADNETCGIYMKDIRHATPAEIKAAQEKKEVTITIGTNKTDVVVGKNKIQVKNENVTIEQVLAIVNHHKGRDHKIGSWDVHIDNDTRFIRVGCTSSTDLYSINELIQVKDEYNKLQ